MKILYTSGADLPYWPIVESRFEAYAARCGANLVNLPKREGDNPQWVIFDAMRHSLAMGPDVSAVWVDADIIISAVARDLFGFDRLMFCQPQNPERVHPKWRKAVNSGEWGVPNMRPYPVTGVAAWMPRHASKIVPWFDQSIAEERFPGQGNGNGPKSRWGDQEVIALGAWELELPFFFFPPKVHSMVAEDVEFGHAAGFTARPMKKIAKLNRIQRVIEIKEGAVLLQKKLDATK